MNDSSYFIYVQHNKKKTYMVMRYDVNELEIICFLLMISIKRCYLVYYERTFITPWFIVEVGE